MAFYAGCSTVKFSPTQSITQTCPANRNSNSESKEKQCCLKDSLNITVKPVVETCKPDSEKDNAGASTNIEVNPKVKYAPKKSLDINGKVKVQNQEVNDFGTGCFGQNCEINKFFFDNKSEIKINSIQNKDNQSKNDHLAALEEHLPYHFISLACLLLALIIYQLFIYLIKFITRLSKRIINFINKKKTSKENKSNNNYSFEILSPYINKDILSQPTKEQLNFSIIENSQIKNIAITGPYGSGKSSIWESYRKAASLHDKKNIIQISFANFNNNQSFSKIENFTEYEIERVIIQQLVYSKENKDLKYSSFQKINNLPNYTIPILAFLYLFLFSTIAFSLTAITYPETVESILQYITQHYTSNELYKNFVAVYCPTILYCFLFYITFWIIQKANKIKISKFCINNIELTFDEKNSLFDKYLNEIVYFFEASKTNLVVIEDLDRFDSSLKIFTKLRELNTLINNYPPTKDSVKFVYLIRDDILSKYERTKFFDFIIPVIPTLSINNSASIFKKEIDSLKGKGNIINLNLEYLINIQDFLKDFRLLKNCINEFFIYKNEIEEIKNKLLLFKYESFIKNKKNINIDELIDEKTFSLILYKNLYPKDFSKLEKKEGILFKCLKEINKILDITKENSTNSSIKDILKKYDNDNTRKKFKTRIELLNDEFNYNDAERVESSLLYTLLFKGYIENDYEMYIKKNNEAILNYTEQEFLFNVKNDIPASQSLELRTENLHYISTQIIDYQWNSPGILNNIIIDYILKSTGPDSDIKASKIVEAMYNFDRTKQLSDRFIPKYFQHCSNNNKLIHYLLRAIEIVLSDLSSTPILSEDAVEEYIPKEAAKYDSAYFLELFFKEENIIYFKNFLEYIYNDYTYPDLEGSLAIESNAISAINYFLDDEGNELFKEKLFDEADDDDLSCYDKIGISINLTTKILKKIINFSKLKSSIYNINKKNIDLILLENKKSTDEPYYLTHCLQVNGLNDRVLNKPYDFFIYILSHFEIVEEDYYTLKTFFDASNRFKRTIDERYKKGYFKSMSPKWEKFVIYNHYASFDNYLSESIQEFMISNNLNQEISNDLKNDETGIKEFVRAVIKKSNIDNNILLQYFLPFWGKYVSILNCYEGEEQEIQIMVPERNHLLQKYTIDNSRNRPSQIMIDLMIKEPDYFIKNYPEEEYAKESKFKLSVLNSDSENLIEIKQRFFKNISFSVLLDDDEQKFNIYKKAGKQIKKYNLQNQGFLHTIKNQIGESVKNLKTVKSLIYFKQFPLNINILRIKGLSNFAIATDDPWSLLLFRNLTYWTQKLCNFIEEKTTTLSTDTAGIKPPDNNNENTVKEINAAYQNIVKNIEFWVNELDEYIKDFK